MNTNRREFIGASFLGMFGIIPFKTEIMGGLPSKKSGDPINNETISSLYPSEDPYIIREVVGAAHTQFDKLKEIVNARPELAKATYDWGFGDWESALGAASHMGRKDIAEFLIEKGARPNIFTYAMLGKLDAVKSMIEEMPGIQRIHGPHGFTLLHHANMRIRRKNVEGEDKIRQQALVDYLVKLGDADVKALSLDISESEKKQYFGKYTFGQGEDEYFTVELNSRSILYLSRGEYIGRSLLKTAENTFSPGGAPSVSIVFTMENGVASSFSIHDPIPLLTAIRV